MEYGIQDTGYGKYKAGLFRLGMTLLFFAFGSTGKADTFRKEIVTGNKAYKQKDFNQAATHYRSAEIDRPGSPVAAYNLGTALVAGESYDEALRKLMESTAKLTGPDLEKAYYNVGNGLFGSQKYQEAAGAYKKALEIDPADRDAKYNLELALKKLQEQKQQQKKNQKQDRKNQKQNQKANSSEPDSAKQNQKQNQQQPSQSEQQNQKGKEKQQPAQPKQQMTKEEAERILAALKDEETKVKKQKNAQGIPIVGGKDW